MNEIREEEITCEVQCEREVVIFDADNLIQNDEEERGEEGKKEMQGKGGKQQQRQEQDNQENLIQVKQQQGNEGIDPKLLQQLEAELKHTHEKFFSIVKAKQSPLKPRKLVKSLQSIEKVAQTSSNSILKQGYMQKKTTGLIFKWKRRYFTLTPEKLYFFDDHEKEKVIGCVNIKIIPMVVRQEEGGQEIVLDFQGECENIVLRCYSKEDREEWKQWLEQVSKYQLKEKKILLKTMNKAFYVESNSIPEREFLAQAETGDILLFYTRHIGASIQRALTNSDFDHVAMIVKFRSYETMIFESNQMSGVALFEWNQYVKYFNLYDKITVRKLISPRKAEFEHNLLKFVKINLGRKYELNISKLFTFESDFNWQMVNQDTTRGYFCSELVAKAYKSIGLLDPVKSSCRYWPVDFSQKSEMKLLKGAYLGNEQTIVLNKHVKKIV